MSILRYWGGGGGGRGEGENWIRQQPEFLSLVILSRTENGVCGQERSVRGEVVAADHAQTHTHTHTHHAVHTLTGSHSGANTPITCRWTSWENRLSLGFDNEQPNTHMLRDTGKQIAVFG